MSFAIIKLTLILIESFVTDVQQGCWNDWVAKVLITQIEKAFLLSLFVWTGIKSDLRKLRLRALTSFAQPLGPLFLGGSFVFATATSFGECQDYSEWRIYIPLVFFLDSTERDQVDPKSNASFWNCRTTGATHELPINKNLRSEKRKQMRVILVFNYC